MLCRRTFVKACLGGAATAALPGASRLGTAETTPLPPGVPLSAARAGEDVFAYVHRLKGAFDATLYKQILGAANPFKEGDQIVGVAAADDASRSVARTLLAGTRMADLDAHPPLEDELFRLLQKSLDSTSTAQSAHLTLGELKQLLLTQPEDAIRPLMPGLSSDAIGCLVKLMSDEELVAVGQKIFNPLPGSQIGAKGYLGARIQPNSPTDNVSDIQWQVFDGWAYGVGDVVLGTNPVSSDPASVAAIERTLQDLLATFGLTGVLPHCVLSHIDVQAEVEKTHPGSTGIWFQSIAGSDSANATFDITLDKMLDYAGQRTGQYGLYFETGQGADFTNGHDHGYDMVLHEARKYGFARALTHRVQAAQTRAGSPFSPWVHLNDVAGFIGPEVFRTREQLVRCCLEDIVMGKLHGLCLGLDVCSTLHMDVSLDDLDWCLDRILPANPAYLMALPTKIDPMLGYLTTGYQDHVRLREKFGYKVNDRMWQFFQELGVIDAAGRPTSRFGDPLWVYLQYQRRKGDPRSDDEIRREGGQQIAAVRGRGVFLSQGHGQQPWDLEPELESDIRRIYVDSKKCLWTELDPAFIERVPGLRKCDTKSRDRSDYILHPATGEQLSDESLAAVLELRRKHAGKVDVQIVVSDGLNALSIIDPGHLAPFLERLRAGLVRSGFRPAPEHIVFTSGRVRAGYRVGESLFAGLEGPRALLHVIGERPGTGHHTFSVYMTAVDGATWGQRGKIDHNLTKVVSGIAATALAPPAGADETLRLLKTLVRQS
ncbi:MAG TPA: ethanolamine ammonia-lyase subunit EutB [Pirellulaceae bacterium]|nr:ethanolamine ammonia-lyase subunit EutB [Pirellulaceae bacterium]